MKKQPIAYLLIIGIALLIPAQAVAQCCTAGNPLSLSPDFQQSHKSDLRISMLYRNSISDTYYDLNKKVDIDYIDQSGFNYLELGIEYGMLSWLSLKLEAGYYLSKYENYSNPDFKDNVASGLADLNLIARMDIWQKPSRRLRLSGTTGAKFPIGVFDLTKDHVKLPVQLQPSSGSFRYHGGLLLNKTSRNSKISIFVGIHTELSQWIHSKNFDYKYGTATSLFAGGGYQITSRLVVLAQLQTEFRGQSKRENNQIVEATGGELLNAIPQISYRLSDSWNINLAFSWPLYRHYNSIQLGNKYSFSVLISHTRNLASPIIDLQNVLE